MMRLTRLVSSALTGHRDGEIRFTGAAGADRKHHVVLLNLFHVMALAVVFRRDDFLAERTLAAMFERAARRFVGIAGGDVNQRIHFGAGKLATVTREVVVLFDDFHGVVDVVLVAFDGEAVVVEVRADVERVFEQAHIFIERAEKRFNLSGNVDGTSHSVGGGACGAGGRAACVLVHGILCQCRCKRVCDESTTTLAQANWEVKLRSCERAI